MLPKNCWVFSFDFHRRGTNHDNCLNENVLDYWKPAEIEQASFIQVQTRMTVPNQYTRVKSRRFAEVWRHWKKMKNMFSEWKHFPSWFIRCSAYLHEFTRRLTIKQVTHHTAHNWTKPTLLLLTLRFHQPVYLQFYHLWIQRIKFQNNNKGFLTLCVKSTKFWILPWLKCLILLMFDFVSFFSFRQTNR